MLPIFIFSFVLLGTSVWARPHGAVTLMERQSEDSPSPDCTAQCTAFSDVKQTCGQVSHCGCSTKYLQAQGDCLMCQTQSPQDAASIQFLVDAEITQCRKDGINLKFKLKLPPEAQAIVDDFDRQSARLRQQQTAFFALQIAGGHVGLVIVLGFAIFSRRVRRDPTFLNFCITWIFSSVVYSLLLYRGTEGNTLANSLGFVSQNQCLVQAALTNGAQVMTACSTMALVIQLWIGLRAAVHGDIARGTNQRRWMTVVLVVLPYVFFFAFAIPSVFVGKTNIVIADTPLQRVLPSNFYCSIVELKPFLRAIYGVTLGLLIVTGIFDALIIAILYRHWWAFRHIQTKSAVSLSILLRVVIFSIYRVVVAVAYGSVLDMPPQVLQAGSGDALAVTFCVPIWVDMLQAAIPLIGFLVLGVNGDMITTMMFWRRDRRIMSTMQTINTTNTTSTNISRNFETHKSTWNDKEILDAETKYVTVHV